MVRIKNWGKILVEKAKKISFPGFEGIPLYDVFVFFTRGLANGAINTRAAAISFNFFIAMIPGLIFLFSLIPYIPIDNFQGTLLKLIEQLMPQSAFDSLKITLEDIVTNKRTPLLSIGFVASLFFSTNAIHSLIRVFNETYHHIDTRTWINIRLISVVIVFILTFLISISVILITLGGHAINYLTEHELLRDKFTVYMLNIGKWIAIIAFFFFSSSFVFYLAPAKRQRFRFISAGSSLSTLAILLSTLGFSYYVNNFGQYNKFFGSLGTIIIILLWINFISFGIIIGFELNASIKNAKLQINAPGKNLKE